MPEKRMAVLSIAFAVGILASDWIGWVACLLVVMAAAAVLLAFLPVRARVSILLICAVFLAGAVRYSADSSVPPDDISNITGQMSAFEGTVASDVTSGDNSTRTVLCATRALSAGGWRKISGNVQLSCYSDRRKHVPHLAYGDRVRVAARLYLPLEPTNPGQFSWKAYLARHRIYSCASVHDPSQLKILSRRTRGSFQSLAFMAKRQLLVSIRRIHPADVASVMSGIVLGSYAYIDDQTRTDFTKTGTLHVLAASGYNCFVIVLLAAPLLLLLRIPALCRSIVTIALLCFYLAMVGPMPSLVRATIVSALMLLAFPLRRVADYTNLFYVAALAVLMIRPSDLFDVGFQLSFLAVGALIYVVPLIESLVRRFTVTEVNVGWNRRVSRAAKLIGVIAGWVKATTMSTALATCAVGVVTAPVVAYYFNYISLTSLPTNLVVAAVMPLIFFDSFLSPLTSLLPHASHYAGLIGTGATRLMLSTVSYFGSMEYSSIPVQSPPFFAILGYYAILYAGGQYVRSKLAKR